MDQPQEIHRIFWCPRCRHTEPQTVPHRTQCPRCGLAIPRPEREHFLASRALPLAQQQR